MYLIVDKLFNQLTAGGDYNYVYILQGSHGSLKTWKVLEFENLVSSPGKSGTFVEVLESLGIWTYRSIFLIISIQEFSHYTSSEIWVYLCALKVHEFIEKVLEFDIGRSWKGLESEMSKCV